MLVCSKLDPNWINDGDRICELIDSFDSRHDTRTRHTKWKWNRKRFSHSTRASTRCFAATQLCSHTPSAHKLVNFLHQSTANWDLFNRKCSLISRIVWIRNPNLFSWLHIPVKSKNSTSLCTAEAEKFVASDEMMEVEYKVKKKKIPWTILTYIFAHSSFHYVCTLFFWYLLIISGFFTPSKTFVWKITNIPQNQTHRLKRRAK